MNIELISVGSELLSGDIVNTNASYIAKKLHEMGHDVFRQFTVDDNKYRLSELVKESYKRCDIVILTGGLGPTSDDITKETVCETLGLKLTENAHCKKNIDSFFASLGKTPTENNYKQATAPEGAIIFNNDIGTACGMCIEDGDKKIILLPGPPREVEHMFEKYVASYIKKFSHHASVSTTLNVFGIGESALETLIKPFCEKENPIVATYCGYNECSVKITATADTHTVAQRICKDTEKQICDLLGEYVYGIDSKGLAHEVIRQLREKGLKISTAESCTGGMLSQSLTSVPHASETVEIGILAYSNRIKREALSVPEEVLENQGAISPHTAMYLAKNVRFLADSDIAIGITGNAGPQASEGKSVGLVYVCIADSHKYFVKALKLPAEYGRDRIRHFATMTALDLARKYLSASAEILQEMVEYSVSPQCFEYYENNSLATEFSPVESEPLVNEQNQPEEDLIPANENIFVFENEEIVTEESLFDKGKKRFAEIINRIFPSKGDSIKDIILKIVSIVAVLGMLVSSGVLVGYFAEERAQQSIIEKARENFDFENTELNEDKTFSAFDLLKKQNDEIKGWITISGTQVDNPIYQTDNNDFYLHHNMLKEKSRYGALYFDFNNLVSAEKNTQNLTIYGHNMKDKSMFGSLENYRSLSFYKNNPYIKLKTLYNQYDYVIFAVLVTNASSNDDDGFVYNYTKGDFESDEAFLDWISMAKKRSLINTNLDVIAGDDILTLSTCCYDFDNARFVVMAKRIPNGETVNVSSAKLNSNVRYPKAWYDKKGLEGYVSLQKDSSTTQGSEIASEQEDVSSEESSSQNSSSSDSSSQGGSSSPSIPDSTSSPSSSSQESSSENLSDSESQTSDEGNSQNTQTEEVGSEPTT